jgi:Xaa-Pro dipeptidase
MEILDIQKIIKEEKADAWIMVDYENKNPTMVSFLGDLMLTRKIFMIIPASGKPYLIAHAIDTVFLNTPRITNAFELKVYKDWEEMLRLEKSCFKNYKEVLMDVSENGLLPRISLADYGSVAFIKSLGLEVKSSGNLLQEFTAAYGPTSHARALQIEADKLALQIKDEAFLEIAKQIRTKGKSDEYDIQQFIAHRFIESGMIYDDEPIVAIGKNASNPHYGPSKNVHSEIKEGDLVLIDMWAKMKDQDGVYADITWMGYVGKEVPAIYVERFNIVKNARDSAIKFISENIAKRDIEGYEVDDAARKVIVDAGYGEYFIHRTGHNIAIDVSPHGPGVNMDDYESHDTRKLIDGICFSIEPGIYAPDFGVRSETNVYIEKRKAIVTAGLQDKIIPILSL